MLNSCQLSSACRAATRRHRRLHAGRCPGVAQPGVAASFELGADAARRRPRSALPASAPVEPAASIHRETACLAVQAASQAALQAGSHRVALADSERGLEPDPAASTGLPLGFAVHPGSEPPEIRWKTVPIRRPAPAKIQLAGQRTGRRADRKSGAGFRASWGRASVCRTGRAAGRG